MLSKKALKSKKKQKEIIRNAIVISKFIFHTLSFFVCLRQQKFKPKNIVLTHTPQQQQKGKIRTEKKYWTRFAQWPGSYNKTTQHAFTTLIGSEIQQQAN